MPQVDINSGDSILASSDLLIFNSPQSSLSLVHTPKIAFQLLLSLIAFSVIFYSFYNMKIKTWILTNVAWLGFFMVVLAAIIFALFPMLTSRIFLGVQPVLYALIIGGGLIQIRKLLLAYQSANLASFSRTKASLSSIQPNYKKSQFGNAQQAVPKDNNEATGYWVRPDPSIPSNNTSNLRASKATLVQDVLPD